MLKIYMGMVQRVKEFIRKEPAVVLTVDWKVCYHPEKDPLFWLNRASK